ncbi:hypothetical protein ASC97_01535 [Rhizobium sp. Root1203]|uniref:hypothetical protein n=1 Tax=Rhizobium sp. Root1203 TaxID=1736427 RepID=UPI0007088F59|nr:hypothetical protein [Rhizobium sp. Root1203]KQV32305.1 hypothetical protein ASC97_01535 [Rhizobium sp. Root1203]
MKTIAAAIKPDKPSQSDAIFKISSVEKKRDVASLAQVWRRASASPPLDETFTLEAEGIPVAVPANRTMKKGGPKTALS